MADKWEYVVIRDFGGDSPVEFAHPHEPVSPCPACGHVKERDKGIFLCQDTKTANGWPVAVLVLRNGKIITSRGLRSDRSDRLSSDINLVFNDYPF